MAHRKIARADLRRHYPIRIEIGFVLAIGLLVLAFRADWHARDNFKVTPEPGERITVTDIVPTDPDRTPPAPPRPAVPIEVPDDELLNDDPLVLDPALIDPVRPTGPPPDPIDSEPDVDVTEIFVIVEEQPKPIGGLEAIYEHITYPEMARRAGVEGMVVVQFVVDEDGNVTDPKVTKGIGAGLDEIALNAVKSVKFTPGKQRGKAVKVRMSLPIRFHLK